MQNKFNIVLFNKISAKLSLLLLMILTVFTVNNVAAQLSDSAEHIDFISTLNPNQANAYSDLTHSLRCLVCQNQSIAESNAPLAVDLREQVRNQLLDGKSSQEIKQFMVDRYGDFVLYKPPLTLATLLLWLGPAVLFLLAAIWLIINIRKHNRINRLDLNAEQRQQAQGLLSNQNESNKDTQ